MGSRKIGPDPSREWLWGEDKELGTASQMGAGGGNTSLLIANGHIQMNLAKAFLILSFKE